MGLSAGAVLKAEMQTVVEPLKFRMSWKHLIMKRRRRHCCFRSYEYSCTFTSVWSNEECYKIDFQKNHHGPWKICRRYPIPVTVVIPKDGYKVKNDGYTLTTVVIQYR
jgi:hypothetical protein